MVSFFLNRIFPFGSRCSGTGTCAFSAVSGWAVYEKYQAYWGRGYVAFHFGRVDVMSVFLRFVGTAKGRVKSGIDEARRGD